MDKIKTVVSLLMVAWIGCGCQTTVLHVGDNVLSQIDGSGSIDVDQTSGFDAQGTVPGSVTP